MTLTLEFLVDDMANETGWIVQSPNENGIMVTYAHEPIRTFPKSEAGSHLENEQDHVPSQQSLLCF